MNGIGFFLIKSVVKTVIGINAPDAFQNVLDDGVDAVVDQISDYLAGRKNKLDEKLLNILNRNPQNQDAIDYLIVELKEFLSSAEFSIKDCISAEYLADILIGKYEATGRTEYLEEIRTVLRELAPELWASKLEKDDFVQELARSFQETDQQIRELKAQLTVLQKQMNCYQAEQNEECSVTDKEHQTDNSSNKINVPTYHSENNHTSNRKKKLTFPQIKSFIKKKYCKYISKEKLRWSPRWIPFILFLCLCFGITIVQIMTAPLYIASNTWVDRKTDSLQLRKVSINKDTIENINKLNELKWLTFSDCLFEQCGLEDISRASKLTGIHLENCTNIGSLTFLKENRNIRFISINGCNLTDNNLDLSKTQVEEVSLTDNPDLIDIHFLPSSVKELDISRTNVKDISVLKQCSQLRTLTMDECSSIENSDVISNLPLYELNAANCGIQGFERPFSCLKMEKVSLPGNKINDTSFLDNLTRLEVIDLTGNPITSLDAAVKSASTLKVLRINGTKLNDEFLKTLSDDRLLENLGITGIQTANLHFLKNMNNLKTLYADGCGIENIEGLSNKKNLIVLNLGNNLIKSSAPLISLQTNEPMLIDLHNNQLTTYELPLNLSTLLLYGNDSKIATTFPESVKIGCVVLDYDESLMSAFSNIEELKKLFILNVPLDQILNLQDALLHCHIEFTTLEQFEEMYQKINNLYNVAHFSFE